jgi:hypothetical protein
VRDAKDAGIAATETVRMDLRVDRTLHKDSMSVSALDWRQQTRFIFTRSHNLSLNSFTISHRGLTFCKLLGTCGLLGASRCTVTVH